MPVVPTDLLKMAMPQKTRTKVPIDTARHVRQGARIAAASKSRRTRGPGNAKKSRREAGRETGWLTATCP